MKKTILIITFIAVYTMSFGQSESDRFSPYRLNKIEVDEACFPGMTDYLDYLTFREVEFDSLNQLPERIQLKAKAIINSTMSGFLSKVHFIGANVIDLDSLQKEDTVYRIENCQVIPKYELHFQLCDTVLGIESYCINLDFDQFGEVLYYSWPTDSYSFREKFIKPEVIKKKALEYAQRRKYKTKNFISKLTYDNILNRLCWHVSFWQKTTYQKNGHTEKFKTIIIDVTSSKHISEGETELVTISGD